MLVAARSGPSTVRIAAAMIAKRSLRPSLLFTEARSGVAHGPDRRAPRGPVGVGADQASDIVEHPDGRADKDVGRPPPASVRGEALESAAKPRRDDCPGAPRRGSERFMTRRRRRQGR